VIWDPPPTDAPERSFAGGAWLTDAVRLAGRIYELRRRRQRTTFAFDECQRHAIAYFNIVERFGTVWTSVPSGILSRITSNLDPTLNP
jgi:hypothetical protein